MFLAILTFLLALKGDFVTSNSYRCQLCPHGRVYPLVLECSGESKEDVHNMFSEAAHEAFHLFHESETAFGSMAHGAMSFFTHMFGRKRAAQSLMYCQDVYNYPNAIQVNYNGKLFIKIHYQTKCAFVPEDYMSCPDGCCNSIKPIQVTIDKVTSTSQQIVPSSATTQFDLSDTHQCNKLEVITSLAHSQTVTLNGLMCRDGTHGQTETVPIQFCNATASVYWRKGFKVLNHCNSIPPFTAVATFSKTTNEFSHGSISGVLISCTDSEIKIASEDCNRVFSVLHVIKNSSASYLDNAENYYTISW